MNYIVVDLEATCEENNRKFDNEVIEIGAVKYVRRVFDGPLTGPTSEFSEFVRPVVNPKLSDFCTSLTSIKQEDVDKARFFPRVYNDFIEWCQEGADDFWLISWGQYDKNQLIKDCARHMMSDIDLANHVNIKREFARIHELSPNKARIGVSKALFKTGLRFEGVQHRGIDDSRNIGRIFEIIFDRMVF